VAERKPGFFVKVKDGENFNRRNTWRILRIKIWTGRRDWRKRRFSFSHYLSRWLRLPWQYFEFNVL